MEKPTTKEDATPERRRPTSKEAPRPRPQPQPSPQPQPDRNTGTGTDTADAVIGAVFGDSESNGC